MGVLEASAVGTVDCVGRFRGGRLEGLCDDGKHEGAIVVGPLDGIPEYDGVRVGKAVLDGRKVGPCEGGEVGLAEGISEGTTGLKEGTEVGEKVGAFVGNVEGETEGVNEGLNVGTKEGRAVGNVDGLGVIPRSTTPLKT